MKVPSADGFHGPTQVGNGLYIVRRLFSLGAGQTSGLAWQGLKVPPPLAPCHDPLPPHAAKKTNPSCTLEKLLL